MLFNNKNYSKKKNLKLSDIILSNVINGNIFLYFKYYFSFFINSF